MVTGAASGIGRATALLLSEMGAKVLLADINVDNLQKVKAECKGETDILVIDLMDADNIKNLVKEKEDSTLMTKEEFFAKIERAEKQSGNSFESVEELDKYIRSL